MQYVHGNIYCAMSNISLYRSVKEEIIQQSLYFNEYYKAEKIDLLPSQSFLCPELCEK